MIFLLGLFLFAPVDASTAGLDAGTSPTERALEDHKQVLERLQKTLRKLDYAIPDTGPSPSLGYVLEVTGADKKKRGDANGSGSLSGDSYLSLLLRPRHATPGAQAALWVVQGKERQRMPDLLRSETGSFALAGPARKVLGVDWTGELWVEAIVAARSVQEVLRARVVVLP